MKRFTHLLLFLLTCLFGVNAYAISDIDGVYQIGTADELAEFSALVNAGSRNVSAVLTADIDMAECSGTFNPIGTEANPFNGSFDGQGHKISNLTIDTGADCAGLFGYVAAPCDFKNFVLDASCTISGASNCGVIGVAVPGAKGTINLINLGNEGDVLCTGQNNGGIIGCNMQEPATFTFVNCYTTGKVTGWRWNGAMSGWVGVDFNHSSFENCWSTADVTGYENDALYWTFAWHEVANKNCFGSRGTQVPHFDEAEASTGALAFRLNKGAGADVWFQTIGEDEHPVLDATHGKVYAHGQYRCDGAICSTTIFDNTPGDEPTVADHNYEDGFCTVCGEADSEGEFFVDGWYLISTPTRLLAYAKIVNEGDTKACAKLTEDIDMDGYSEDFQPIGTSVYPFSGTFDGQGHVISNLNIDTNGAECAGLFGYVAAPCTFKDFIMDATCTIKGGANSGMIGMSVPGAYGDIYFTNLGFEGDVIGTGNNCGAIIGCNMKEAAIYHMKNCYSTGNISAAWWGGAISGWVGNNAVLENCWSTAEVTGYDDLSHYFTFYGANLTMKNCYCVGGTQATHIEAEDAENGKLAYLLNGNQSQFTWFQNLGEDAHPVMDDTHGIVLKLNNGTYMDIHDESSFANAKEELIAVEREYANNVVAQKSLVADYLELMDEMETMDDVEEFIVTVNITMKNMRVNLENSAKAYAAYQATVDETITYLAEHKGFPGPDRDFLVAYLEEYVEPGETYPNGSYPYIIDEYNRQLTTVEIQLEAEYVKNLLKQAIQGGYKPGDEVTRSFVNADFTNGANGWTFTEGGYTKIGAAEGNGNVMEVMNKTFNMSQTLEEMKDGLYELRINADSRFANDFENTNQTAFAYINDNCIYLPLLSEETASESEVEGVEGHSEAYAEGKFENRILAMVSDGKLTIGVKNLGMNQAAATWLGNIHVFYLGQKDEAGEALDNVLACQARRAQTLFAFEAIGIHTQYPNYSADLRQRVKAAIDAVATVSSAEEKLALVQTFSALFQEAYECKVAYIAMMDQALMIENITLSAGDILTAAQKQELENAYTILMDAYDAGSLSSEDAKNTDMIGSLSFYPVKQEGVYQLESAANVIVYAAVVNAGEKDVDAVLTTDLDMAGANFQPIGCEAHPFSGTFDGQGHKISNLTVDLSTDCAGLFGQVAAPCTFQNLTLDASCSISGNSYCGMIGMSVGYARGEINFINLGNEGSVSGTGMNCGGIVGCDMSDAATYHFKNCYVTGSVAGSQWSGAISGWVGTATTHSTFENCWSTADVTGYAHEGNYWAYAYHTLEATNCYGTRGTQVPQVSVDDVASGRLTYLLNGDQTEINWYQTLGADAHPVWDAAHGKVYNASELRCDGKVIGDAKYTNDADKETHRPDHQFHEVICTVCGQPDYSYLPMKDGFYQIADAAELALFAKYINFGNTALSAQLTDDINMADVTIEPIGTEANPFCGTFDGQGHTISNLIINTGADCAALFSYVAPPCVIENMVLDETCTISGGANCGMIGMSVRNVYGDIYMRNLGNEGDVLGTDLNCGGIIGCNMGEAATYHMSNCYSTGKITASWWGGAISGWVGNNAVLENCWSTAEVVGYDVPEHYVTFHGGNLTMNNCYCTGGTQSTIISNEQVTSGELCYKLNEGNTEMVWYQTLGEDAHPVFDASHGVVHRAEDGSYYTGIESLLQQDEKVRPTGIYNLQGVRLQKLQKGVNIVNGKLILVK